jgi:hypothetical protein
MNSRQHGCLDYRSLRGVDRRRFLQAGALGGLGVTLSSVLRAEASAADAPAARAKSVVLLWLQGGVSHHETFDPKPGAPVEIRGEFAAIPTKLPGVRFSEHLPRLAGIADKLAVVRSVRHGEATHQRGSMYMVEGRRPSVATGINHSGNPELGCIVAHELGMRAGAPPFMSIPGNDFTSGFTGHGYLPATAAAFKGTQSKSLKAGEAAGDRVRDRLALLKSFEGEEAGSDGTGASGETWDRFEQQAVDVLASGKCADAFRIQNESEAVRKLYGIDPKRRDNMGGLALTARRLIEAGVRYVTIGRNSWDHHEKIFPAMRERLPTFDDAFAGLVVDLEQRGLLDETLVVYLTEYGRTPRVNAKGGRDHWPSGFSIAFAGAGIRPGQVVGATDSNGGAVKERPVAPEEVAATILHLVGVNPQRQYVRTDGRPMTYVDAARPIGELLG